MLLSYRADNRAPSSGLVQPRQHATTALSMTNSYRISRLLSPRRRLRLAACLIFLLLAASLAELTHADHCEADVCQVCSSSTGEGISHSVSCTATAIDAGAGDTSESTLTLSRVLSRPYDVRGPPSLS